MDKNNKLIIIGGIILIIIVVILNKEKIGIPGRSFNVGGSHAASYGGGSSYPRAGEVACTIAGYDNCYGWTESYQNPNYFAKATATAKLGTSYIADTKNCASLNKQYVLPGTAKVLYVCYGDQQSYNFGTVGECGTEDYFDCPGTEVADAGEIILNPTTASTLPAVNVYCWDYNYKSVSYDNSWAWVTAWVSTTYDSSTTLTLNCCSDSDCESGFMCDKTNADYKQWICKPNPCNGVTCPNACVGNTRYFGGTCTSGTCNYQSEVCAYQCDHSGTNACISDPCAGKTCPNKCEGNTRYYDGTCSAGNCNYRSEVCDYQCGANSCIQKPLCPTECCNEGSYQAKICSGTSTCVNNACVAPPECTNNNDCSQTSTCFGMNCYDGKCLPNTGMPAPPHCPGETFYGELSHWNGYPGCNWVCSHNTVVDCSTNADCVIETSIPNDCTIFWSPKTFKDQGTCSEGKCLFGNQETVCSETQLFLQSYKWIIMIGAGITTLLIIIRRRMYG